MSEADEPVPMWLRSNDHHRADIAVKHDALTQMRKEFEDKLREEARRYKAENAPHGLPTCPNCANRIELPASWGEAARDFWHCTAPIVLPAHTYVYTNSRPDGSVGLPFSLRWFDPACPLAERLNSRVCPLFKEPTP